ncbi:MAG: hypothetical protein EBS55_13005 [Flavobacteriaceae bacterium]|nr:hypothetical protein [Flavobacteriaceae bacterium]
MLTIQNLNKLNHKTLGKKNFFVARVEEQFSIDNINYAASEYQYKFELSNMKYAITVILNREPAQKNKLGTYFKLHSSNGRVYYITQKEISNMDVFIDKLRYVALG